MSGALADLSPQQQELMRLVPRDSTNRRIGKMLFLSPRTIAPTSTGIHEARQLWSDGVLPGHSCALSDKAPYH